MTLPSETPKTPVAIIGSGNIGTDLMIKVIRRSRILSMGAMVGIDPPRTGWHARHVSAWPPPPTG